jgi:G3E family GTPase
MRLESIVTTVDALFAATQSARHPEFAKQVALADRLVVTKTDLATPETIEQLRVSLTSQNPAAPIVTASHGAIDPTSLFPPSFFDPTAPEPYRSGLFAESIDPDHATRHAVASLSANRPLHWRRFEDWLRRIRIAHADHLLRIKGMLDIDGVDGPVVVQGVHHVLNAPVELDAWPPGERTSRLVLIADHATIAFARESWATALPTLLAHH